MGKKKIVLWAVIALIFSLNIPVYASAEGGITEETQPKLSTLRAEDFGLSHPRSDECFWEDPVTSVPYEFHWEVGRSEGDGKITFNIDINRVFGDVDAAGHLTIENPEDILSKTTATLTLVVWDEDLDIPSHPPPPPPYIPAVDIAYLNGYLLGALNGPRDEFNVYSWEIPVKYLIFPAADAAALSDRKPPSALNKIEIKINTSASYWALQGTVFCDFASLEIKGTRPVILVHGLNSTPDNCWKTFIKSLDADHVLHYAPKVERFGSIANNAWILLGEIGLMKIEWGVDKLNVVAHSKGGLDTRQFLTSLDDLYSSDYFPDYAHDWVENLIMLATPNEGATIADEVEIATIMALPLSGVPRVLAFFAEPALSNLTTFYVKKFNERVVEHPSTVYSVLAGHGSGPFSWLIPFPSDGVVEVSSVKSLPYVKNSFDSTFNHLAITDNPFDYEKVIPLLKHKSTSGHKEVNESAAGRELLSPFTKREIVPSSLESSPGGSSLKLISSICNTITSGTNVTNIDVDSCSQANFLLMWGSDESGGNAELDLILEDPAGRIIDPTAAASDPNIEYSSDDTGFPGAKSASYRILNPISGAWKMKIKAVTVTDTADYVTIAASDSDKTITISTNKEWYQKDEVVSLNAALKNKSTPIIGSDVSSRIKKPDGSFTDLTLYDNGTHGDITANDGLYANSFNGTALPGIYWIVINVSGSFTGMAMKSVTVAPGSLDLFNDDYSESTEDTEPDGLSNTLTINAGVNITTAGNYRIVGDLKDSLGNNIQTVNKTATLPAGSQFVPLEFDGLRIHQHGEDGPYYLKALSLYCEAGEPVQTDFRQDAYTTSAYGYSDFQRPDISLTPNKSDVGVDTDGNGKYNFLDVNLEVDVTSTGNYAIEARLMDKNDAEIVWANTDVTFASAKIITLRFDGAKIGEHAVDGPYQVKNLSISQISGGAASTTIGEAYTTLKYKYADFENAPSPVSLTITDTSLSAGTKGAAYSQSVHATGGVTPYHWSLLSGSLPDSLTLADTGLIYGTPTTTAGSPFNFTVRVADSQGTPATATKALSIVINPAVPPTDGDINGDGAVNITDVILCLRQAIGLDPANPALADMNGDGLVNITDVILILRKAIGLDPRKSAE